MRYSVNKIFGRRTFRYQCGCYSSSFDVDGEEPEADGCPPARRTGVTSALALHTNCRCSGVGPGEFRASENFVRKTRTALVSLQPRRNGSPLPTFAGGKCGSPSCACGLHRDIESGSSEVGRIYKLRGESLESWSREHGQVSSPRFLTGFLCATFFFFIFFHFIISPSFFSTWCLGRLCTRPTVTTSLNGRAESTSGSCCNVVVLHSTSEIIDAKLQGVRDDKCVEGRLFLSGRVYRHAAEGQGGWLLASAKKAPFAQCRR